MFKKSQDNNHTTASPLRIGEKQPVRSKNVSVIGPTLVIKGELSADEDLVIEGHIEGMIQVGTDSHQAMLAQKDHF